MRQNLDTIREEAEATSSIAQLLYIDVYLAGRFAYLRFNYATGDAAGQNMVGLATQRECLEIMDCYGKGKVRRFAEFVAGVALAGEISLVSAISSFDWVSSHEEYGRNR